VPILKRSHTKILPLICAGLLAGLWYTVASIFVNAITTPEGLSKPSTHPKFMGNHEPSDETHTTEIEVMSRPYNLPIIGLQVDACTQTEPIVTQRYSTVFAGKDGFVPSEADFVLNIRYIDKEVANPLWDVRFGSDDRSPIKMYLPVEYYKSLFVSVSDKDGLLLGEQTIQLDGPDECCETWYFDLDKGLMWSVRD